MNQVLVFPHTLQRSVQESFTLKQRGMRRLGRKLSLLGTRDWAIMERKEMKVEEIGRPWVQMLARRREWMAGRRVMKLEIGV
jgi:hypothetical protein